MTRKTFIMNSENISTKQNKNKTQTEKVFLWLTKIFFVLAISSSFLTTVSGQNAQHTENNTDQSLRGSGRVNQSSLGLEFDIPLGGYSGRGINVPIGLSYSSKLWRLEYHNLEPHDNDPGRCFSINTARYGESSASGWTTSLGVPYIEYNGEDNLFDENGFPVNDIICPSNLPTPHNYGYIKRLTVHLPSGETHELRADDTPVLYPSDEAPSFDWDATFYAVDGSNLKYVENSTAGLYRLFMPDGSFYDFSGTKSPRTDVVPTLRNADRFTDRSGNFTTYFPPGSVDSNGVLQPNGYWKDTLGRNIPVPFKPEAPTVPTVQNYQMPGTTGVYKFHWKQLKGDTAAESALTDFSQQLQLTSELFPSDTDNKVIDTSERAFNPIVLTAVELPTGQFYRFSYNVYGEIERVFYPTGGEERFTYAVVAPLSDTGNSDSTNSVHWKINRGVSTRKVYVTAGSNSYLQWTYSAAKYGNYGYMVTITAPDGTYTERLLHRGYDNCTGCTPNLGTWGYDNILSGMAYEERSFSAASQLLSKKLTHWTKTSFPSAGLRTKDWHPRATQEETIIYDETGAGLSTTLRYEYEGNLSLIETPLLVNKSTQYAFVVIAASGSLQQNQPPSPNPTPVPTPIPPNPVRIVETTYLINDTVNYPDASVRNAYKNQNMVGLVTISKIRDGAGIIVSQSEMRYDETGAYPIISAGTSSQWQNPNTNYRGNSTTSRIWDSTKGIVTNTNAYIATHAQFDNFGNQQKSWDAKGNLTETEYASTYGYAFATKVTSTIPDPNPSQNPDGLPHGSQSAFVTEATFNAVNGLPLTSKDPNGLETRLEYDAATLRLKKTSSYYANQQVGATNEYFYNDQPNNYWIKTKTQIDTNKYAESITYLDGLARAYKSEQIDSQGNIFVEKEFDANGRVLRVTGPFRTGETKQWTTNVYDEASRIIEVVLPDGSKVKTNYGISTSGAVGVTKIMTDQAGKKRKGISDALGRMIRVIEDPSGLALPTDYVFDTLGNLRKTTQGEQSRYFSFDSLGRLLRAKQPEQETNTNLALPNADAVTNHNQWSVSYNYDDNGNIVSTTDAGNVTVTAIYDKLNRVIYRSYSDLTTPPVSFYYDGKGLDSIPNYSKGQTTKVSSSVSETRYTSFDNMGRLLTSQQLTTAAQRSGAQAPYTSSYAYNLSGALVSETYPSGRVVTNQFDQDGEMESVWGTQPNQTSAKVYLNQITRNTAGGIEKMRLGNGRWETAAYNERQQITKIGLGYSDTDKSLLNLEYDYGTNLQNNDSLRQQKISYTGLTNQIIQDYAYDNLNRLQSATETVVGSPTPTWKQSFSFDRFGNRVFDTNNTTTLSQIVPVKVSNPIINTSDNRLKKDQDNDNVPDYDYDKNGNLVLDAENKRFVFDAENRQTKFFEAINSTQTPDATYYYDGEGRRVRKISGQNEVIFVYNASGQLIAEYSNEVPEDPKVNYLTADHLGSPRIITDAAGTVVSRHDYRAFGDEIMAGTASRTTAQGYGSDDEVRQQYTGYERDTESGLDFAQARYYNSKHGRFTSVDPLTASAAIKDPQTFNRYSYALNSPYKFTDPLGLISESAACGMRCQNSEEKYSTGEGMSSWSAGKEPHYQDAKEAAAPPGASDTQYPLPAAAHSKVNQPNEVYANGFVLGLADGGSEKYYQGSIALAPVLSQINNDATWAFNRGKQEMILFENAIEKIRADFEDARRSCQAITLCAFVESLNSPQMPSYEVGQLIPTIDGQIQIGTGDYPGFNITLQGTTAQTVKAYNDYVSETSKLQAERREAFVESNRNTIFSVQVSTRTSSRGWQHVTGTRSVTLTAETLRGIHTRRVNIGRSTGQTGQ
jgi:RHS repeat-associated protein